MLTDFAVLGTSRASACIRFDRDSGRNTLNLPLVTEGGLTFHVIALSVGTIIVKAIVLPGFLRWAIREAAIRRKVADCVAVGAYFWVPRHSAPRSPIHTRCRHRHAAASSCR